MDAVTVGSASSRTFLVCHTVTPEAMTYGRGRSVHGRQQCRLPDHFV